MGELCDTRKKEGLTVLLESGKISLTGYCFLYLFCMNSESELINCLNHIKKCGQKCKVFYYIRIKCHNSTYMSHIYIYIDYYHIIPLYYK